MRSLATLPPRRPRDRRGLVTLEWLLITGAVGAFAALAVLVVERTVDAEVELPPDPVSRLIDADIDAAFVAADAVRTAVRGASTAQTGDDYSPAQDDEFRARCERIAGTYEDVVASAAWDWDWDWDAADTPGVPLPPDLYPEGPAHCRLLPRNLSSP
ncbi:MAG: hypothetical protein OXP08_05140 [bacterium]|nr:hypothetical protein [bacterium]